MSNLSVADWRTWKNAPTDPTDPVIQAGIAAAEEAIGDDLARLMVVAAGSPSSRLYVPTPGLALRIHDCVSVDSVTVDGTLLDASEYQLEPVGQSWSGRDEPYTHINLYYGNSWADDFGRATVDVSAVWGWSVLPAWYTEATKILSADLIDQRDIRNGVAGFAEFGAVRVRENATVVKLLSRHRMVESIGLA